MKEIAYELVFWGWVSGMGTAVFIYSIAGLLVSRKQ